MNEGHITKTEMQRLRAKLVLYYKYYTETKEQADAVMKMINILDRRILGY